MSQMFRSPAIASVAVSCLALFALGGSAGAATLRYDFQYTGSHRYTCHAYDDCAKPADEHVALRSGNLILDLSAANASLSGGVATFTNFGCASSLWQACQYGQTLELSVEGYVMRLRAGSWWFGSLTEIIFDKGRSGFENDSSPASLRIAYVLSDVVQSGDFDLSVYFPSRAPLHTPLPAGLALLLSALAAPALLLRGGYKCVRPA